MIKYPKITDISLVIDTISKKPISKVPLRYRYQYIDIGDTSTIFSIYRPTSTVDWLSSFKMTLKRQLGMGVSVIANRLISQLINCIVSYLILS